MTLPQHSRRDRKFGQTLHVCSQSSYTIVGLYLYEPPLRCNPSSSGPFCLITGVKFISQQQQQSVWELFITKTVNLFMLVFIRAFKCTWFYRTIFSNVNVATSINAWATASLDILLCLLCCLVFYTSYNIRHH